jgi:ABC-2 type transport system permease protein
MLRIGAAAALAGPTVLLGRALFFLLVMLVLSSFWGLVGAERVSGLVGELPPHGLMFYVGVTEWITLSVPAVHLRLEDDLRRGGIEAQLLRPVSPLLMRLAEAAGGMVVRLAVLGGAGVVALQFTHAPAWGLDTWAALLVLGLLGAVLGLLFHALVGLSSFWLRSNLPAYLTMQKACFLFGGLLAPITLYPAWLAGPALWSPFAAHLYWPAALTLRPQGGVAAVLGPALLAQGAWMLLLGMAVAGVWRAGLRRVLRDGV